MWNKRFRSALIAIPGNEKAKHAMRLYTRRIATSLAGIRAGGDYLCRLPSRLFKASSGLCDRSGVGEDSSAWPLRGQRRWAFCKDKTPPASRWTATCEPHREHQPWYSNSLKTELTSKISREHSQVKKFSVLNTCQISGCGKQAYLAIDSLGQHHQEICQKKFLAATFLLI